jgi:hypothetical protein
MTLKAAFGGLLFDLFVFSIFLRDEINHQEKAGRPNAEEH